MILLLVFAFLAGLVTILAPCVWPVLPIVLSASVTGLKDRYRPLSLILGIILSFTFFTLFTAYLIRWFHLDPNLLRSLAVALIMVLGLTMVIPRLEVLVQQLVSRFTARVGYSPGRSASGFVTGLSLGILWTPCAGPILATIATLAAIGQVNLTVILVTLAYITGVGLPLLALALGGRHLLTQSRRLSPYLIPLQRTFGVVMILAAVMILTQTDQKLQLFLLNRFPALGNAVNGFESSPVVQNQLALLNGHPVPATSDFSGLFNAHIPAPDFVGIDHWLNTSNPLSFKDLKGKVVLVDFWTYTCINCLRTLPHISAWYDKYKAMGFVVIGVHTPEFQFEHETKNVEKALIQNHISYPVAQDNVYATWNNYGNEYWPAEYLIDNKGVIRRTHFGEGEYDQMEMAIQALLKQAGHPVSNQTVALLDQTPHAQTSPETYLGSNRMQYYFPGGSLGNGTKTFTLAPNPASDSYSLGGIWTITDEAVVAGAQATLNYNFTASNVYIILRPASINPGIVKVSLDDHLIDAASTGTDVQNGLVTVTTDRLYNLVDLHGRTENHLLRLEFLTPGVQAYTFTFG